jgi:hypothetical protein
VKARLGHISCTAERGRNGQQRLHSSRNVRVNPSVLSPVSSSKQHADSTQDGADTELYRLSDRQWSRGQRSGSPTAFNLSFVDRSRYFSCKYLVIYPHEAERNPFQTPFSVLRSPFPVLRSPFSVLRSPFPVPRSKCRHCAIVAVCKFLFFTSGNIEIVVLCFVTPCSLVLCNDVSEDTLPYSSKCVGSALLECFHTDMADYYEISCVTNNGNVLFKYPIRKLAASRDLPNLRTGRNRVPALSEM